MATKGYTTPEAVQQQLGRTLTHDQMQHLNDLVIPAAEQWIDENGGRAYGEGVVTAEILPLDTAYMWLSKTPIVSLEEVRGYFWGQTPADSIVIDPTRYSLLDVAGGRFWLPSYRSWAHVEVDYTPDPTIPERIKLAAAILCGYYMRTVIHPETEWLTDYSSGQDIRLKFREMSIPEMVLDLIGGADAGYVIA